MNSDETASVQSRRALDNVLTIVTVVLGLVTLPSLVAPWMQIRFVAPATDLVLDTVTAGVSILVAANTRTRYHLRRDPAVLYQGAAFVALALANVMNVLLVAVGLDAHAGMSLSAPAQAPVYVFTVIHLVAGALFVVGALASRRQHPTRSPLVVIGGSALVTLALIGLIGIAGWSLPPLAVPAAAAGSDEIPGATPLGAGAQLLAAGLFLWAAAGIRRIYLRDGALADAYLAVGLVFSAFAQVAAAAGPGIYTGLLTSADVLRLVFDMLLLAGIQAETVAMVTSLRRATAELTTLRAAEVEHAALEERSRLARELHDGVAQNLWLAKLKVGRLASLSSLDDEATALTGELGTAIEAGLAEAHEAVAALRMSGRQDGTLAELLRRLCNDFADRYGIVVDCDCEPELPRLGARTSAECLRVVQEALSNVRRHADATTVRVIARVHDGRLTVTIRDNGCGFDPVPVWEQAFGLASMRERATMLGGELRIESRQQDGTSVHLVVPLPSAALGGSEA